MGSLQPPEVVGIDVRNPLVLVEPAEQGAAAAAAEANAGNEDAGDLRRSVTSLLEAMRDLLSNIHLPSDVPNDGDVDSDDEHED